MDRGRGCIPPADVERWIRALEDITPVIQSFLLVSALILCLVLATLWNHPLLWILLGACIGACFDRIIVVSSFPTRKWRKNLQNDVQNMEPATRKDRNGNEECKRVLIEHQKDDIAPVAAVASVDVVAAEDINDVDIYKRLDSIEDPQSAHQTCEDALKEHPHDWKLLWRFAKCKYVIFKRAKLFKLDAEEAQKLLLEGLQSAEAAVAIPEGEQDAEPHKWVAIMAEEESKRNGQKAKILGANVFQKHTMRALEISPDDSELCHMYGRFMFELSKISWTVRRVAAMTMGSLPDSSFQEALDYFYKARQSNPDWIMNSFWLAKTLIELKKIPEAKEELQNIIDNNKYRAATLSPDGTECLEKSQKLILTL